ncbi:MAG: ATP-binding protein [Bacteroidales bacterium]|jgi:PAS domain S-box-containing protein|nr:ATP-binding protein [Bacteroidales bacterium]
MRNNWVTDKLVTKEFTNIDQKVRDAQVQLLYEQTKTGLIGVLIVSLTACVVFWQVVPQWKLSLWTGIIILLTLTRGGIVFAFQRRATLTSDIDRWATLHVIGVIVSSLTWAIPFIFLWPTEYSIFQLVWPIFVLPLSAAAVAMYYTWSPSYISFLVLTALPISLRFFFEGGTLFNIMGLLSLFFIAVLLRAGKVMHASSMRAFELGIRNELLNVELKVGITTREQLNARLQQEIVERKLAENEIRKLSKVFLDGTNPTFIQDLNGNILEMNDESVNVYGFSREELVDKSIKLLVPDGNHEKMDELIKLCIEGKLIRDVEGLRRKKDGNEIPVLITLSLLTDEEDNPFGIASIDSNITEQKNIEKELTKSKAAAESANATKDKFFEIISHDLRSPFNSIIGFSELLIKNVNDTDNAKSKKHIDIINSLAKNTLILLDNLLNWAKSQTGELSFRPEKIILSEVILEIIGLNKSLAKAKNISLYYSPTNEIELYTDENILKTVLRNLISNAIKFTNVGGNINILTTTNQQKVEISISDNGVGMNEETIYKLFETSTNVTSLGTANEKGSGLGLMLCKEFVEKLNGKIWVESEEGKGSDFKFTLPLFFPNAK